MDCEIEVRTQSTLRSRTPGISHISVGARGARFSFVGFPATLERRYW
jgi:hypothetical protein